MQLWLGLATVKKEHLISKTKFRILVTIYNYITINTSDKSHLPLLYNAIYFCSCLKSLHFALSSSVLCEMPTLVELKGKTSKHFSLLSLRFFFPPQLFTVIPCSQRFHPPISHHIQHCDTMLLCGETRWDAFILRCILLQKKRHLNICRKSHTTEREILGSQDNPLLFQITPSLHSW